MKIQKTRAIKHLKNIRMMTAITKNKWNIKMKRKKRIIDIKEDESLCSLPPFSLVTPGNKIGEGSARTLIISEEMTGV